MTKNEITSILTDKGISLDTWTTLEGSFKKISMIGDRFLHVSPTRSLFNFTSDNVLLVRYLDGTVLQAETPIPENHTALVFNGKPIMVKNSSNGKLTDDFGVVHTIISFNSLSGFYDAQLDANLLFNKN